MRPTELLKDEHKDIKLMLQVIDKICEMLEAGKNIPSEHLEQIVAFIQGFADKCHHAKEEDLLFPAMEECGFPRQAGPIGVMLLEHEEGRRFVRAMKEATEKYKEGDRKAAALFVENAQSYIALLRQHIDKEDNILYEMADRNLSGEQNKKLEEDFERVEKEVTGPSQHEEFKAILNRLKEIYLKKLSKKKIFQKRGERP